MKVIVTGFPGVFYPEGCLKYHPRAVEAFNRGLEIEAEYIPEGTPREPFTLTDPRPNGAGNLYRIDLQKAADCMERDARTSLITFSPAGLGCLYAKPEQIRVLSSAPG